ncbi:hypothetical protein B0H67DRAFT_554539 [Lasiosphaeris hirsuta]|uniref:Uncharacterized protein n=1 Tax=Lasiosphaeris hirsuta TaxID=260670 RepID=A0AA40DWH9_9PEZI|nr:hypothetical protein B0H67DRAFT_554539 [Lasiosphaeris hirsuta]
MSAASSAEPLDEGQEGQSESSAPPQRQRRPRARPITRDEGIEIRALHKYAKMSHEQIAAVTPFSINQIKLACSGPRHPRKPDRWSSAKELAPNKSAPAAASAAAPAAATTSTQATEAAEPSEQIPSSAHPIGEPPALRVAVKFN